MPFVDALETQRAVRRLRSEPVDDALILRMIEIAQKAPTGGNEQRWAFIVVKDAEQRHALAKLNRRGWPFLRAYYRKRLRTDAKFARMIDAVKWQVDHFEEIPVVIVVCHTRGPIPAWPPLLRSGHYGSVYPAVQNLLLAARALGLGASLTTLALWSTSRARHVLGLPRKVTPIAVVPVGWPIGRYGPTTRAPVGDVVHVDRWGNQPYRGAEP
jgi:nitroreductase